MSDTKRLKALKRKLRERYNYSTNTDYNRGMGLIKRTDDENGDFCFYIDGNQTLSEGVSVYVNGKLYPFDFDELYAVVDAIQEFNENVAWVPKKKRRSRYERG